MALSDGTYAPAEESAVSLARREAWQGIERGWGIGLELLASILLWTGLGLLVDRMLGTTPWFFAVGVLGGYAVTMYLVWLRSAQAEDVEVRGSATRGD